MAATDLDRAGGKKTIVIIFVFGINAHFTKTGSGQTGKTRKENCSLQAVLRALSFEGWEDDDTTPQHFRDLVQQWGASPATRDGELRQLLIWGTGSDELPAGTVITVKPASTCAHLPSAATCTMEVLLPPGTASAGALEASLATALGHISFGVE